MEQAQTLSRNQQIVLDIIEKAKGPLKAYSILFNVQKKGINAPQQIYRALDKLIEMGKIHKIESKNAFVACRSSDCEISKATAFSICESCEMVDEISDTKLSKYLSGFNHKKGMKFKRFNLEFSFTLPTSDKSYLSELKNRLLKIWDAISIVGGSPGLRTL